MKHLTALLTTVVISIGSAHVLAADGVGNYCTTQPVRSNAVDWPSKHAWDLFASLNHPAMSKSVGRGVPDCTRPLGQAGTTAVWETWRNAESEVYLADGREPPLWGDTSLPDAEPGKVPLPKDADEIGIMFSPEDGVFHNAGGFGETRMNRATYEFVRSECLYSVEGQQRYAKAVDDRKKAPIKFPVDSIEVKAAWIDFEDPKGDKSLPPISEELRNTYYTADFDNKKFGLVALHILTKDIPNWYWASFHHKDQPTFVQVEMTSVDDYGPPPVVKGTVWENYKLGGIQNDFVTPTGAPTILSDQHIEFGFVRSSCMSCHSTATISNQIYTTSTGRKMTVMPNGQRMAVCSITPADGGGATACKMVIGEDAFVTGSDKLVMERGIPNPKWFQKDGKPFYQQTDFVWSIPFRGRSETSAPPARCIW